MPDYCMPSISAISFEDVSKRFTLSFDRPQTVLESIISIFRPGSPLLKQSRELWAVRDVTFDIGVGQCVGIIGRNGSGKSTLLKLCTRILRPNEGQITVRGRVSAMLELGTGFHPDLSGRENIYLNASLLGLNREDVQAVLEDIIAFAEIGEFIDVPVKNYSSGMYMRLGFSVAIHMRPDILIVDEILAVGDQAFQNKCYERIYQMKKQGVTIVIVSHHLETIRELCSHVVWMDLGRVRQIGKTEEVLHHYLSHLLGTDAPAPAAALTAADFNRFGSREIEITSVRLLDGAGAPGVSFKTGDPLTIEMRYHAHKAVVDPEFGLALHRLQDGVHVVGPNNRLAGRPLGEIHGEGVVRYQIDHLPLLPAKYLLTVAVHDGKLQTAYDYHEQAYTLVVVPGGTREEHGLIEIAAEWTWERIPADAADPSGVLR